MENRFWGTFGSFFLAVLFLAGGIAGYFYLNRVPDTTSDLVDISPETGYDWGNLSEGMHVHLAANTNGGYYCLDMEKDEFRVYFTYDFSMQTKRYNHILCVYVEPQDYDDWESLVYGKIGKNTVLKRKNVDNYVRKMTSSEYANARNTILSGGEYDLDEVEELLSPYIIAPKEEKTKNPILNILDYAAIVLGAIFLVGSIVGVIKNR